MMNLYQIKRLTPRRVLSMIKGCWELGFKRPCTGPDGFNGWCMQRGSASPLKPCSLELLEEGVPADKCRQCRCCSTCRSDCMSNI